MCCGSDSGEEPTAPALPAPINLTPVYQIQLENLKNQNAIKEDQLGFAKRQEAIGTERHQQRIEGYRPIEKKILDSANRGIDPAGYEARARNEIVQDLSPTLRGRGRTLAQRGINSSSPRQEAERLNIQSGGAKAIGARTYGERTRIEGLNQAIKGQAYSLGANIPQEVVAGYSSASGISGQAGAQQAASANNLAGLYQSRANANYQGRVTNYQTAYNQYKNDLAEWNAGQGGMGIFGAIGGIVGSIYGGPIGGAAGGAVGSHFDSAFA